MNNILKRLKMKYLLIWVVISMFVIGCSDPVTVPLDDVMMYDQTPVEDNIEGDNVWN